MKFNWKIFGIILLVVFIMENAFLAWGYYLIVQEDKMYAEQEAKMNECYYEKCYDYPEADFKDNVCYCYDVNAEGTEYELADTTYMS